MFVKNLRTLYVSEKKEEFKGLDLMSSILSLKGVMRMTMRVMDAVSIQMGHMSMNISMNLSMIQVSKI